MSKVGPLVADLNQAASVIEAWLIASGADHCVEVRCLVEGTVVESGVLLGAAPLIASASADSLNVIVLSYY